MGRLVIVVRNLAAQVSLEFFDSGQKLLLNVTLDSSPRVVVFNPLTNPFLRGVVSCILMCSISLNSRRICWGVHHLPPTVFSIVDAQSAFYFQIIGFIKGSHSIIEGMHCKPDQLFISCDFWFPEITGSTVLRPQI